MGIVPVLMVCLHALKTEFHLPFNRQCQSKLKLNQFIDRITTYTSQRDQILFLQIFIEQDLAEFVGQMIGRNCDR